MKRVIIFHENGARMLSMADTSPYEGLPGVVIDPDLSHVTGHPPHHWRLSGGKVLLHDEKERKRRDRELKNFHWDHQALKSHIRMMKAQIYARHAAVFALAVLLGLLIPLILTFPR